MLPNSFPHWKTVYDHFSRWNRRGVWKKILGGIDGGTKKIKIQPEISFIALDTESILSIHVTI